MADWEFNEQALAIVRRAYARQMQAIVGATGDDRLAHAFATVRRERFLGDPPWRLLTPPRGHVEVPSSEPVLLYQDLLFALAPERGVNNGSPSLHMQWLHAIGPIAGAKVAHLGAGTGYYTALLAHLVGAAGSVLAVEFDPALAERARANLGDHSNVAVMVGDGADWPAEPVDLVYVNFSVERPAELWIERLRKGGRLIMPLGVAAPGASTGQPRHAQLGAALLVERREHGLAARFIGPAFFVCAEGRLAASEEEREALRAAFRRGDLPAVRSLGWRSLPPPERCWHTGRFWALGFDEAQP